MANYRKYQPETPRGTLAKETLAKQQCAICRQGYATHAVLANDDKHVEGAQYMQSWKLLQGGFSVIGFVHDDEGHNCHRELYGVKPEGVARQIVHKPSAALDEINAAIGEEIEAAEQKLRDAKRERLEAERQKKAAIWTKTLKPSPRDMPAATALPDGGTEVQSAPAKSAAKEETPPAAVTKAKEPEKAPDSAVSDALARATSAGLGLFTKFRKEVTSS